MRRLQHVDVNAPALTPATQLALFQQVTAPDFLLPLHLSLLTVITSADRRAESRRVPRGHLHNAHRTWSLGRWGRCLQYWHRPALRGAENERTPHARTGESERERRDRARARERERESVCVALPVAPVGTPPLTGPVGSPPAPPRFSALKI